MIRYGDDYRRKVSESEEKRLYQEEKLLFDATELISELMEKENITRSELARRIGKTKSYVTQVLRGKDNMTLRTLSRLVWATGYSVSLGGIHARTRRCVYLNRWPESIPSNLFRCSLQLKPEIFEANHALRTDGEECEKAA